MTKTTTLKQGFYPLQDTDTRGSVVAFFGGTNFFMPGSNLAFPEDQVHRDGYENEGRFNLDSETPISLETGWKVENGTFL